MGGFIRILGLDLINLFLSSSANFRASLTVSGSGYQPAALPSSTTGGASKEVAKTWTGRSE